MAFKRHFSILLSLLYFCFAMEASWLCAIPVIDCQGELPKVLEVRSPRPTWNMWDKQNLTTFRTTTPSVVTCVGLAVLNKFFAVLYFKDGICVIVDDLTDNEVLVNNACLFTAEINDTNIALGKPTYATPRNYNSDEFDQSLIVDGNFDKDDFRYTSIRFLNAWIMIDLEAAYHIKRIRVMPDQQRQDYLYKNVEFRGGNALVLDGNFSSYEKIIMVEGPLLFYDSWNVIVVDGGAPPFQFLSLQTFFHDTTYFSLLEVEVYVQ